MDYAQFLGRDYAEAIDFARNAVRQRADLAGGHRVLTAAAAAGDIQAAERTLQDLRRAQPNISLAWIIAHLPIRLDAEREHHLDLAAFRKAGLESRIVHDF